MDKITFWVTFFVGIVVFSTSIFAVPYIDFCNTNSCSNLLFNNNLWQGRNSFYNTVYISSLCNFNGTCFDFSTNYSYSNSSDNTSWNQGLANTLYAPISTISYNVSWNESRANSLYAPIGSVGGGNASWNESYARTIFALIGSGGNTSWNESRANALYVTLGTKLGNTSAEILGVANASGYIINWNSSGFIRNQTSGIVSDNTSWNQGVANGLYASISTISDNTSWNEGLADSLYYLITNPNNFINLSNLTNYYTKTEVNTIGNYSVDRSQITFKNESNTFIMNQTMEGIIFEKNTTNHIMYDNSSCIIISSSTSTLEVC